MDTEKEERLDGVGTSIIMQYQKQRKKITKQIPLNTKQEFIGIINLFKHIQSRDDICIYFIFPKGSNLEIL